VLFIRQSTTRSCDLLVEKDYFDDRIRLAIQNAHRAGLRVVLKPQFLVSGSWAGEIESDTEEGWACWFAAYREILVNYAKIANETKVEVLVVGTELTKTELRPEWKSLLMALRENYSGQISYVGQSFGGAVRFSGYEQLDSVAISFYPSMEDVKDKHQMLERMQEMADNLKFAVQELTKPFWFAEIGITSRVGALENPWLWVDSLPFPRTPDPTLQADVLDGWLSVLRGNWHQGILIWSWYSDPKAGGFADVDFTIQNKPAMETVACHWLGTCK
jgi:hypothetical protein